MIPVKTVMVHFRTNFSAVFVARMIEWEHAVSLFLFGYVLLVNPGLFEGGSYVSFLRIWDSQIGWAGICMIVGALRFLILAVNGLIRRSPHLRAMFAAISAFVWMQLSLGFLASGNFSTALAVYPTFIFWEFAVFLITVRYAKAVDVQARHARTDP